MSVKYLIMHEKDNCATSLEDLEEDTEINDNNLEIKLNQDIALGHKFAVETIEKGDYIYKYGEIIGNATEDINIGDWIHTHNIKSHYLEEIVND